MRDESFEIASFGEEALVGVEEKWQVLYDRRPANGECCCECWFFYFVQSIFSFLRFTLRLLVTPLWSQGYFCVHEQEEAPI